MIPAEGDPTLFVARYLRRSVARVYGLEEITEREGEAGYRWTKCDILETSRRDGTDGLAICEGHEAWWRAIADSVVDGPDVRVTQNMRDGAPWCEVWLRRMDRAGERA